MYLNTHQVDSQLTPCQRVVLTPELATLVFLHTEQPAAFNATCRLFHEIATSPLAVYNWFDRRYYQCEQAYQLLRRRRLHKQQNIDVGIAGHT